MSVEVPTCPHCHHPLYRQCNASGITGNGCLCVLLPEGTVDEMSDTETAENIGPVKSQSIDGITVTHYRPLPEVLAIISAVSIVAFLLILLAAVLV